MSCMDKEAPKIGCMNIKQSLTEYVQKEIRHHLENNEGITAFSHRVGIQSQRIKGFLAGVSSLQLNTADRILKAIDEWKEYK